MRAPIQRGTVVYDVADPRHHGIVRTLHLRNGKFYANVQWIDTGWRSYRIPVADLRRWSEQPPDQTECDVMRLALNQKEPTS